jgi:Holliday junction resolvase RusA-like endonuclease
MIICKLTLPVPPLLNRLYRMSGKRVFKNSIAKSFQMQCFIAAHKIRLKPVAYDVELDIVWYRARRNGDIDSILKCLLDALETIIYVNDSQVVKISIYKTYDKENPRLELTARKFIKQEIESKKLEVVT